MKIIDLEAHFFTETYVDYLRKNKEFPRLETVGAEGGKGERLLLDGGLWAMRDAAKRALLDFEDARLAEMDANHVAVQVLSLAGPGCELFKPSEATALVREINDEIAGVMKKHPDRFVGLAALAPQDPEGAADELERAVQELGFKGAKINSHIRGGEYLDQGKYWVLLERAEALGVPIYLHPRPPSPAMLKPYAEYGFRLAGPVLGFAADTSLAAMRLIYSGVFDRFPGLKIILGHLGEALPFWLNRVNHLWGSEEGGGNLSIAKRPSEYIKDNFVMTTSGMSFVPAFMCAYLALGAESIMFAVDYPFEKSREAVQFMENLAISEDDKHKICHLNAEKLLNPG